jgi:hypothetical protein
MAVAGAIDGCATIDGRLCAVATRAFPLEVGAPVAIVGVGSYVTHDKLADLGAGEVVARDEGTVRIRFASGDRTFAWDRVVQHLVVTRDAPVLPPAPSKAKAPRKPKAPKAAKPAAAKPSA